MVKKFFPEKTKKPNTFEKSFASHQHVSFWHPTKNGKITPRDIYKHTRAEFWWHCDTCSHDYLRSAFEMRTPCPYCAETHTKLCGIPECQVCHEKSLASHPRADQWHPTKNGDLKPHQILKGSMDKCWFQCDMCPHAFNATLHNVTGNESWCPYCCAENGGGGGTQKLCDDEYCDYCLDKSLASIPKVVQHWHPDNEKKPRDILKGSNTKVKLRCSKCPHDFTLHPYQLSIGIWCSYCPRTRDFTQGPEDFPSPSKLCGERSCMYCLPFSFASHPRADQWHPTKNGDLKPHQVHRGSGKKCWFRCHKCPHDFEIKLCKVSTDRWCSYCTGERGGSTVKMCDDENCDYCFNNSLASSSFAMKLWFQEKNGKLNPRHIKKGSPLKCWWKCDVCFEPFTAGVGHVYNGQSCPVCKNKTEGAVYRALKEYFGDKVKHLGQKKYKKTDPLWKPCPGYFDMVIENPSGKTCFVEVDGRQHFEYVEFFRRTVEESQEIDLKKHIFALERGCYVIRIDQAWVANQITKSIRTWETRLIESVNSQVCTFISNPQNNRYANHKCYLFETNANRHQPCNTSSP